MVLWDNVAKEIDKYYNDSNEKSSKSYNNDINTSFEAFNDADRQNVQMLGGKSEGRNTGQHDQYNVNESNKIQHSVSDSSRTSV